MMGSMNFMRVIAVSACLASPGWSQAASYVLTANLDGSQAGTASMGTGTGSMTYDDLTKQLSWDISFAGLSTGTTVAHFHGPAAPGANAGVQVTIPLGTFSGMTSGTLAGMATINSTQESHLLSNLWYINIHTTQHSGGEIRGQAQVVPLPAAVWLFGSGLIGLAACRRRRVS